MWNGGVGRVFFFFCKGSLLWQRTGACAPSLLNFTRTRNCPYPEAFLFVYWLVWQVYITQRCCYFAAQFFFSFFFSLHITVLWHGTLGCLLLLFSWWFLCFLSFCWWGASSFFHPLLACFSRNFFIKTNFSLAMFSIVVACGLLRFSFCSHQHAGMLQGWLPRGRALRKTWFHLVWLKCSRPKWPLKLVYVC